VFPLRASAHLNGSRQLMSRWMGQSSDRHLPHKAK